MSEHGDGLAQIQKNTNHRLAQAAPVEDRSARHVGARPVLFLHGGRVRPHVVRLTRTHRIRLGASDARAHVGPSDPPAIRHRNHHVKVPLFAKRTACTTPPALPECRTCAVRTPAHAGDPQARLARPPVCVPHHPSRPGHSGQPSATTLSDRRRRRAGPAARTAHACRSALRQASLPEASSPLRLRAGPRFRGHLPQEKRSHISGKPS